MSTKLTKKGKIFYIEGTIRFGDQSVRIRETTGCSDQKSAEIVSVRRCAEIVEQLLLGEIPTKARRVPGFATAAADYEEEKATKDKKPLGKQDRDKLLTLGKFFGEKRVNAFEADDWDDFVSSELDDPAPATIRRWFSMFSPPLVRAAKKFKFMLPQFLLPAEGPLREIFLEPGDRDGLLAEYAEHAKPVALTLCMQGCRHFEALRLDWEDVSFDRNTLTYRETKNGSPRVGPMHPEVRSTLEGMYHGQNGPVFTTRDGETYLDRRLASHGDGPDGSGIRRAHATALRRFVVTKFMKRQPTCRHCGCTLLKRPGHSANAIVQLAVIRPNGEREELSDYSLSCHKCDRANPPTSPAKINWFRIHDWRHHWASWFIMDDGDETSLMTLGGWKNQKMVARYVKLDVRHLAKKLAQTQRR
jgi:integrase